MIPYMAGSKAFKVSLLLVVGETDNGLIAKTVGAKRKYVTNITFELNKLGTLDASVIKGSPQNLQALSKMALVARDT